MFTTTPAIVTDKLVSLADPKANFAAQNVIPLVYKPAATPTITSTLNAVVTDKQNYSTVAAAFLQGIGMPS